MGRNAELFRLENVVWVLFQRRLGTLRCHSLVRHVVGRHIFSCDTGATASRPIFGRDFAVDTEGQIVRIRV
jgi:hypothetical protein